MNESLGPAVREFGDGLQILAEIVSVRIDREQVDVHGQNEIVGHYKMFFAWRNIQQAIVFQLQENRVLVGGLVRRVQNDGRLKRFQLFGMMPAGVGGRVSVLVQAS